MARFSSATKSQSKSQRSCVLFDLPLPIPANSIYRELDLDPTATAEQVGWAIKLLNDERRTAKSRLDDEIRAVALKIPGLLLAYEELKNAQAPSAPDERRLQKLAQLENHALDIDPSFQEKRRRARELEDKIDALNALDLGKLAGLSKYDEAHPPLALFKLSIAVRDDFLDQPRTQLWLLRRDITRFLQAKGESVAYLNDLDREDFTADFRRNRLLDGDD